MKIAPSRVLAPFLVALLCPAVGLTAQEAEPEIVPIVEKAIAFHGGDLYESTESSFEIASRSGTFRVEARRNGGVYRQVVESVTQEGPRRVVVTNDDVELSVGGERRAVSDEDAQRWRDHVAARVWFPFLPYGLAGDGVYTHDRGMETWPVAPGSEETRELHKVKVTFQPGTSTDADDEYLFWFDPETGRMEQLAYSFDGGLRFRHAKNYRRIGGILFSDQDNYALDYEEGETGSVDQITPAMVEERMEKISTIELRGIEVREVE